MDAYGDDDGYRRKAKIALVAFVLLASIAVFALGVAFVYYCYIHYKVSKHRKAQKGLLFLFLFPYSVYTMSAFVVSYQENLRKFDLDPLSQRVTE